MQWKTWMRRTDATWYTPGIKKILLLFIPKFCYGRGRQRKDPQTYGIAHASCSITEILPIIRLSLSLSKEIYSSALSFEISSSHFLSLFNLNPRRSILLPHTQQPTYPRRTQRFRSFILPLDLLVLRYNFGKHASLFF